MNVLFLDDDPMIRKAVGRMLRTIPDLRYFEADSKDAALRMVSAEEPDLVLVDVSLSASALNTDGLEFVRELQRTPGSPPCVMVSSSTQMAYVREAMRLGARDYVAKEELSVEMLVPIVEGFRDRLALASEVRRLRTDARAFWGVEALRGSSEVMRQIRSFVVRVANASEPVLVCGDTGTGKELVARALHEESRRAREPFVAVNCAAIPGTLLESTLFGHERGAFSGADRRRRGRFEAARGGTLLLDEVSEMPLELQAKLLRVLETSSFLPVGGDRELPIHARIVAATNAHLPKRIEEGRFRRDLFYRLHVITIDLPRLSARGRDVEELLTSFLEELPSRPRIRHDALTFLLAWPWEGNVRELRNAVVRLSFLSAGAEVDVETAKAAVSVGDTQPAIDRLASEILSDGAPGSKLAAAERVLIRTALERASGNKTAAARILGIDRKALDRHWERVRDDGEEDASE